MTGFNEFLNVYIVLYSGFVLACVQMYIKHHLLTFSDALKVANTGSIDNK